MAQLNFNLIAAIRDLAPAIELSGFSELSMTEMRSITEPLNDYFGTTDRQTWIMVAVILKQMSDHDVSLRDLVSFFGLQHQYMLELKNDVDQLVELRLLLTERTRNSRRIFRSGNFSFFASEQVMEAVFKNLPLDECSPMINLDLFGFCEEVGIQIQNRSDDYITTDELGDLIVAMENKNPDIVMVKELRTLRLDIIERVLLYEMMNDYISGSLSTTLGITLKDMFSGKKQFVRMMDEFVSNRSVLLGKGIVSVSKSSYGNDLSISFTQYALELFASEELGALLKNKRLKVLTSFKELTEKKLFFDKVLGEQISFLTNSLQQSNFIELQSRLAAQGYSQGVAALFYGSPGTGKTETALQLALSTGRDVYRVEISESKSMWYGETEKKIKGIFENYRLACKHSERKPILLFNEADALFGTRRQNLRSSVDQTENAIQNIILEEMESLDGILIATTNLTANFDSAFDRRFLFKIEFQKPSSEAKKQIWRSKLNELSEDEIGYLADNFDFTGGEIDNIVRKVLINRVLTGNRPSSVDIIGYCKTEKLSHQYASQRTKVGFYS